MARMTAAEIEAVKYGPRIRRQGRNIAGLHQPGQEAAVAKPEPSPAPPLSEAQKLAITTPSIPEPRPQTGLYALKQADAVINRVRPVGEADLEELLLWGIPRIQRRYPRCTAEGILPFLRMAMASNAFRFLRTDHAGALFQMVRTAWEPEPTVFVHFVIDRQDAETRETLGWEVVELYQAGLAWAEALRAVSFRFDDDACIDLEPVAKRIGAGRSGKTYVMVLR